MRLLAPVLHHQPHGTILSHDTSRAARLVSRAARSQEQDRRARDMDHHGERRSSAHGAAARAWRGGGGGGGGGGAMPPPQPPKVYRVEPRDFRELVQRLTGAGSEGVSAPGPGAHLAAQQRVTPAMVVESWRLEAAAAAVPAAPQQFDYAAWYSAPLLSPAYGAAGYGGHPGGGPLL